MMQPVLFLSGVRFHYGTIYCRELSIVPIVLYLKLRLYLSKYRKKGNYFYEISPVFFNLKTTYNMGNPNGAFIIIIYCFVHIQFMVH